MGKSYEISHKTVAGWNGIELDGEKETLTFFAPAKEEKKYTLAELKQALKNDFADSPARLADISLAHL